MGDSAALASKLIDLMVVRRKRATASLARDFGGEEPLPKSAITSL